jgi:hypothetical protein
MPDTLPAADLTSMPRRRKTPLGPQHGLTTADVAARYRVGEDTVRHWIKNGSLAATNTAKTLCGKPRWVVTREALAVFEQRRAGGPPPKPTRKKKSTGLLDYYPD